MNSGGPRDMLGNLIPGANPVALVSTFATALLSHAAAPASAVPLARSAVEVTAGHVDQEMLALRTELQALKRQVEELRSALSLHLTAEAARGNGPR